MYVVTGVTGHTGSVVANTMLGAGKQVRVVVRSEDKGRPFRERGAEVAVADVDDEAALGAALRGAEGVYLLIPPPAPSAQGILARSAKMAAGFAAALRKNPVPHVVLLSSVGAQHPDGTGPIAGLHTAEQALSALPGKHTFVRAAYFMENLGALLGAVHGAGVLPSFTDPSLAFPMVATQDIGETAAHAFLHPPAQGEIIELSGPKEYSLTDAAAEFSRLLGKPIQVAPVPPEGIVPALTQVGMSEEMAGLYREMSLGINTGRVAFAGHGARSVRGKVPLSAVIAKLLGK